MNQFSIAINGRPYFNTKNESEVIYAHGSGEYVDNAAGNEWWINTSDILTRLIQEAGRWCERHASDLFYIWRKIDRFLLAGEERSRNYLFGFRRNGVCDNQAVYENKDNLNNTYRSLWNLQITCCDNEIDMWLWRVNI